MRAQSFAALIFLLTSGPAQVHASAPPTLNYKVVLDVTESSWRFDESGTMVAAYPLSVQQGQTIEFDITTAGYPFRIGTADRPIQAGHSYDGSQTLPFDDVIDGTTVTYELGGQQVTVVGGANPGVLYFYTTVGSKPNYGSTITVVGSGAAQTTTTVEPTTTTEEPTTTTTDPATTTTGTPTSTNTTCAQASGDTCINHSEFVLTSPGFGDVTIVRAYHDDHTWHNSKPTVVSNRDLEAFFFPDLMFLCDLGASAESFAFDQPQWKQRSCINGQQEAWREGYCSVYTDDSDLPGAEKPGYLVLTVPQLINATTCN